MSDFTHPENEDLQENWIRLTREDILKSPELLYALYEWFGEDRIIDWILRK